MIEPVELATRCNLADHPSPSTDRVILEGRHLHFTQRGAGPLVVLETGASGGGTFCGIPDALAQSFSVVTYDRAGVGKSDPRREASTIREIAADLHGLLQARFPGERAVIVGWSLSGLSALIHPLLYSGDVRGLVLIDPTPFDLYDTPSNAGMLANPRMTVGMQRFMARLGHGRLWGRAALDNFIRKGCGREPDPLDLAEYVETLVRIPRERAYPELLSMRESCDLARRMVLEKTYPDVPLHVLSAEVDTLISAASSIAKHNNHRAIASLSPQGRYIPVPGGSHMMSLDRPDAIVDAVRSLG